MADTTVRSGCSAFCRFRKPSTPKKLNAIALGINSKVPEVQASLPGSDPGASVAGFHPMSLSNPALSGTHAGNRKAIHRALTDEVENANFSQSKLATRNPSSLVICPCGPVSLDAVVAGFENMFFTDQVDHSHAYKGALVAFGNDNHREDHANL